jgi:hypothetical protein
MGSHGHHQLSMQSLDNRPFSAYTVEQLIPPGRRLRIPCLRPERQPGTGVSSEVEPLSGPAQQGPHRYDHQFEQKLMTGTRIRLTRAELYEKVWAAPMRAVAQEFGLSASGLTNVCRKHNVPVPPVGHWTKIEVGHKVTRPPLIPELSGHEAVDIYVRERLSPELAALAAELPQKLTIPQELTHTFALRTEKLLVPGKETEKKLIVPRTGTASHLFVSREQLPRALRIINALFLALEERGHAVSWPKDEGARLTVSVDGEAVTFCVREATESVKHVLTPGEQKHPWMAPKWDYKLTGRLRLSIDNLPYSSGPVRGTWADGRIQLVENRLGDFIVGVKVAAAAIKKRRLESEEWARRHEEERKQREEQQRKTQEYKRKAECITELIQNWQEAERVRAFVKAMTECSGHLELADEGKRDIQQVLDWTNEYADSLDPFLDLLDSIDEFVHPERKYAWLKW